MPNYLAPNGVSWYTYNRAENLHPPAPYVYPASGITYKSTYEIKTSGSAYAIDDDLQFNSRAYKQFYVQTLLNLSGSSGSRLMVGISGTNDTVREMWFSGYAQIYSGGGSPGYVAMNYTGQTNIPLASNYNQVIISGILNVGKKPSDEEYGYAGLYWRASGSSISMIQGSQLVFNVVY